MPSGNNFGLALGARCSLGTAPLGFGAGRSAVKTPPA